ncbi:hypothetical protein I6J39_34055 (plasmid) [Streptomyces californicus]|uniref:Uncharacterized protein n=2 Tax=Streptomyces TaxID=1883 RepID=A0ABX7JCC1_9ACTN|nr:hypothetical protein [Streptomyces californicus]QRV32399.1 hypothetical protein I6J39_34050 [Streptomyces californicus]QRV32400.1 hypothetical protein I6J39_34055 [Streptomyces californicus]QRV45816.1 hypothetical protein I6J41_33980 [Streptomyces californicus]
MKPNFTAIQRIPDEEISPKEIRYLALVQVDLMALYRRWGRPDIGVDSLAEWLCFAFALPSGEKFTLQREAYNPPTPGFLLSVTSKLFSAEAAGRLIKALDIPEACAIELSSEVAS